MRDGASLAVLIVGDLAAFLAFATLGLKNHEASPTTDVFIRTVAPLTLSWFLIAPWFGAFRRELAVSPIRMALILLAAWLVAGIVGLLARSLIFDRPMLLSFILVVLVVQGTILVGWRMLYAALNRAWLRSRLA